MNNMAHYPKYNKPASGFFTCLLGTIVVGASIVAIAWQMVEWTVIRLEALP